MYTHCPHCDTYFRVTSEQLKQAGGDVRCGRCFGTFNALQHLIDEPPEKTPAEQEEAAPPAVEKITPQEPKTKLAAAKAGGNIKRDHSQQLIEELQTRETGSGGKKRLLWGLLSLPLALLLVIQYGYFNVDRLSQNPELRPALLQLCQVAGCRVPLIHAPKLIKLTQRDIRSHPDRRDILLVKATMVNEAPFTQAFPIIELVLHDITGHTIAGRRFQPKEYLVDPSLSLDRGFASKSSVTIVLELVDPGAEAVGFEFQFL
jgi:predicted Zn finger-like uncharacterized protein